MRNYELMLLLDPTLEADALSALIDQTKKLIEKNGGSIGKLDEWGKKRLAYPIEKLNQAYYVLQDFSAETDAIKELDRVLHITEGIVRFMIARKADTNEKSLDKKEG